MFIYFWKMLSVQCPDTSQGLVSALAESRACCLKDDNCIFLSTRANVISPGNMAEQLYCGRRS